MTLEEMDKIRGIVDTSMAKLKEDFEKDINAGFDLLNKTLEAQIKTRVSEFSCENHRKDITEERLEMMTKITILETTKKITTGALAILIPIALIGIVYGIMMYSQVQDLRDNKNYKPQIIRTE